MQKIVFLHGFYASGQCVPALALRDAFEGRAEVKELEALAEATGVDTRGSWEHPMD